MNIKIGDRIKFRAATRHADRSVWRVVNGLVNREDAYYGTDPEGESHIYWPTVRYHGWQDFVVRPDEIIEHKSAWKSE